MDTGSATDSADREFQLIDSEFNSFESLEEDFEKDFLEFNELTP